MVWFSYTVDRSGLFQGELAPRRIVDLMLQGYDVSNFEQMNEIEREVVQLFTQDVPEGKFKDYLNGGGREFSTTDGISLHENGYAIFVK